MAVSARESEHRKCGCVSERESGHRKCGCVSEREWAQEVWLCQRERVGRGSVAVSARMWIQKVVLAYFWLILFLDSYPHFLTNKAALPKASFLLARLQSFLSYTA